MPEMAAYTLLLLPVRQKIIPGSGVLQEAQRRLYILAA